MITTHPRQRADAAALDMAVAGGAQLVLLAALWATVGLGAVGWLAGIGYVLVVTGLLGGGLHRTGRTWLGPADRVTLARAVLVGLVTALVVDRLPGGMPVVALVAIAAVALVLDGVDGRVARRTGTSSALGARFDMEVDSVLVLVLSIHVASTVGAWVLLIGVMRYAFIAASRLWPWLRATLPARYSAKTVAAVQGIVLVVAAAGVLPGALTALLVGVALVLLVWSFGRDVVLLWRRAHVPAPADTAC
jgi:phosphatidylglycerophosphate synthase